MRLQVIEKSDELTHVSLHGSLDSGGSNKIDLEFTSVTAGRGKPTIVDLTDVSFIASMGIRLLISCAKPLAAEGAKLVLLTPHPLVEELLTKGGVTQILPLAHSMDEAKQLLGLG